MLYKEVWQGKRVGLARQEGRFGKARGYVWQGKRVDLAMKEGRFGKERKTVGILARFGKETKT